MEELLNIHHHAFPNAKNRLIITTALILGFCVVELIGGLHAGSLALLSDAGHTAADTVTFALAAFAAWIADKPRSHTHTYGFGRAEVVSAWASSFALAAVTVFVLIEAIHRLKNPHPVSGPIVMLVAGIGFCVNLTIALLLKHSGSEKNINTKSALLHVASDMLGSIIVLISGVIIHFTHWSKIDPILSIIICALILFSAGNMLRESLVVLMESVPKHIDVAKVEAAMLSVDGVTSVHDMHIWSLTSGVILLTAHVVIKDFALWPTVIQALRQTLDQQFAINHATLQPEVAAMLDENCNDEKLLER